MCISERPKPCELRHVLSGRNLGTQSFLDVHNTIKIFLVFQHFLYTYIEGANFLMDISASINKHYLKILHTGHKESLDRCGK